MFYNAFLHIMGTLTSIFGYRGALHIKDASCYLVGSSFGILVMIWLMADFYLNVDVADENVVPPLSGNLILHHSFPR